MATVTGSIGTEKAQAQTYPTSGRRFDWLFAGLSAWVTGGLYLDGWAHRHGQVDNTFFTPWHGLLYSGVLAIAVFLFVNQWRNMDRGYAWRRALPAGYTLSLIGAGLFILGGGIDFIWHDLFGFEVNLEALLSPAHLLLATSGLLMIAGPLRSAYARLCSGQTYGWLDLGPLVLALTLVLSVITFFTAFAHPVVEVYAAENSRSTVWYWSQSIGIVSIVLQTGVLMGMILFMVRDWRLPFGALTLMIGLNAALLAVLEDTSPLMTVMLAAGLLADVVLALVKPSTQRPLRLYLFAFVTPLVVYGVYFVGVQAIWGVEWTIHLWLGTLFMAGIAGLFASFLVVSPLRPSNKT